jgi:transposase, IS5 family
MYRKTDKDQLEFENFYLPFSGNLRSDNRWVELSAIIPWQEIEEQYASLFSDTMGAPAKTFRIALGALIIKERLSLTDEETVEQIRETPYLQYFIGFTEYKDEAPFNPSMMVHFRKRITSEILTNINDIIVNRKLQKDKPQDDEPTDPTGGSCADDEPSESCDSNENSGTMMIDASVAPADIAYPTDLNLLNESREQLEDIIDTLYEPIKETTKKPRTYRQKARKDYLFVAKRRKAGKKAIRQAIKKQLQYIRRDMKHIERLFKRSSLSVLSSRQYRNLLVINELYRQQESMFERRSHSIEDRIVSIAQPHVRPIVRGKASANVEFGAKIMVSQINELNILEEISWDNVNEATLLQNQIERYHDRMGVYPEAVLADKLYRNRDNLQYCKIRGIRLSGPKLGRPCAGSSQDKKIEKADSAKRNAIEGTFGTAKRRYSMNRIMMKLRETSETSISLIILVMNLEKLLRDFCVFIFFRLEKNCRRLIFKEILVS